MKTQTEEKINQLGYSLIDTYFDNCGKQNFIIDDSFGYRYDVSKANIFCSKKFGIFNSKNPYTIYNIALWINLNNLDFFIYSDNVYKNCENKLRFHCNKCNNDFYTAWYKIQERKYCHLCNSQNKGILHSGTLEIRFPELIKEWNYNKNICSPSDISAFSAYRASWVCSNCNYVWETKVSTRTIQGCGCPNCARRITSDKNSLMILYPFIAEEWDFDKNINMKLEDISFGSTKKVGWICNKCGFKWDARINSRTNGRHGCPKCNFSKGERRIEDFLRTNNINYVSEKTFKECFDLRLLRFDFYLSHYNICIEYNGEQHYLNNFHSWVSNVLDFDGQKRRDEIKKNFCEDNNIELIIISYKEFNKVEEILSNRLNC